MISSPERSLIRTNRFARDLKKVPDGIKQEAYRIATSITQNIFAVELDVRPLTGFKGYYRVIVSQDFRMVFSFDDKCIYLHRIAHRKDIYRNLEL
ncbi:MAG: type II toxin-antitoxin system mRNA interferase toxin, RelE/StbE family [Bacteroidota bacterium]|nr:type II toxin-antitoxin system mRNA interferase toxin, RelE/StbE family [Bacteroidota bacterium]